MPCFSRMRCDCRRDLAVHAGQDAVEEFDHRHLRAEPPPHRAELEPDHAGADHEQVLRHLVERERAGRGHDALLVDLDAREPRHVGAGGDDDVLGLQRLRLAVGAFHLDLAGRRRCGRCRAPQSILFFLSRNSTPLTLPSTPSSLNFISAADRASACRRRCPSWRSECPASSNSSEACSSAFDGMQPTLRQVPPKVARFSTTATFSRAAPRGSRRHSRRGRCR